MIEIPLNRGKVAIVDDEDYPLISKHHWCAGHSGSDNWYARSYKVVNGKQISISMHRLLLNVTAPQQMVDHVNGNGLDNRRANLRLADYSLNQANRIQLPRNTSGFRGVTRGRGTTYVATFCRRRLGTFATAEEAAKAYDGEARAKYGEYARLNFPQEGERQAIVTKSPMTLIKEQAARIEQLEAAIRVHREVMRHGIEDCPSVTDCADHALYAVLREEVKG